MRSEFIDGAASCIEAKRLQTISEWEKSTEDHVLLIALGDLKKKVCELRRSKPKSRYDEKLKQQGKKNKNKKRKEIAAGANAGKMWTKYEDDEVMRSTLTDAELAKKLSRSYGSVCLRRYRLRNFRGSYVSFSDGGQLEQGFGLMPISGIKG